MMQNNSPRDVLVCEDVSVRFPLIKPSNRWHLVFGKQEADEWHDALIKINFRVPKGKIIGVIGRNGAGKSTLLRSMAGVYPLNNGRVIRLGPVSALFELGGMGGFLITGKQYVLRWLRFNGIPRRNWLKIVEEVRDFSELGDRLDDRIYSYSAGMAARLYFSTATSFSHKIYLIDEVLSVGDEHFQAKCWLRIRERLAHGVSGVLVTHDWSAILRLCEQALELSNGQIVAKGDSEKIICDYLKLSDQLSIDRSAYFSEDCPTSLSGISGRDWFCDIPVKITKSDPVFFNYSIEKLVLGQDWQILILGEESLVASSQGNYIVRIKIPALPIPSGEYRLNLFLTGVKADDRGPKIAYDIRSWTTGNSIKFLVNGESSSALILMPMEFELR